MRQHKKVINHRAVTWEIRVSLQGLFLQISFGFSSHPWRQQYYFLPGIERTSSIWVFYLFLSGRKRGDQHTLLVPAVFQVRQLKIILLPSGIFWSEWHILLPFASLYSSCMDNSDTQILWLLVFFLYPCLFWSLWETLPHFICLLVRFGKGCPWVFYFVI